jgi:hypothetical protein
MWDIHFPAKPVEKLFNWSPKEWRTVPGYNFKDQTEAKSMEKLPYIVAIAKIENRGKVEAKMTLIDGVVSLEGNAAERVREMSLYDVIKSKMDVIELL